MLRVRSHTEKSSDWHHHLQKQSKLPSTNQLTQIPEHQGGLTARFLEVSSNHQLFTCQEGKLIDLKKIYFKNHPELVQRNTVPLNNDDDVVEISAEKTQQDMDDSLEEFKDDINTEDENQLVKKLHQRTVVVDPEVLVEEKKTPTVHNNLPDEEKEYTVDGASLSVQQLRTALKEMGLSANRVKEILVECKM